MARVASKACIAQAQHPYQRHRHADRDRTSRHLSTADTTLLTPLWRVLLVHLRSLFDLGMRATTTSRFVLHDRNGEARHMVLSHNFVDMGTEVWSGRDPSL